MKDGGLRTIFRHELSKWQWTSVETAGSASGVPDSEFCTLNGVQGWVEFKQTKIYYVHIKPLQVAWLMRRCRMGGRAWIAVRRTPESQKESGQDELWLMRGDQAEALFNNGLEGVHANMWSGGPKNWNFEQVGNILNY
jgi:hypothetical protein